MNKLILVLLSAVSLACSKDEAKPSTSSSTPDDSKTLTDTHPEPKSGSRRSRSEPSTTPPPSEPVFGISKVVGTVKSKSEKKYINLELKATAKIKPPRHTQLVIKSTCKVGSDTLVETGGPGQMLDDTDMGQTKLLEDQEFFLHPLDTSPSQCQFTFGTRSNGRDPVMNMGDFCYVPPNTVKEGVCP